MNILPLVCALLFVLVLGSTTLIRERMATHLEEKTLSGFMQAEREMQKKIARKLYASLPSPRKEKRPSKKRLKESAVFDSRRESSYPHNASSLNISKLLSQERNALLYQGAANLLRKLYGHAAFFKESERQIPDLEYRLLDEMLIQGKGAQTLTDLSPETPLLRETFYKMLKGTNRYDIRSQVGYPPLADFLTIERERKPIAFCFASRPVLESFFGEAFAREVIDKEKKKWEKDHRHRSLTQKEVREMVMHYPQLQAHLDQMLEILHFSYRSGKRKSTVGTDPATGISICYRLD